MELTKNRIIKQLINTRIEEKIEAEKQLAISSRGERLVDLILTNDVSGIQSLIANNTFVEVYNIVASDVGLFDVM